MVKFHYIVHDKSCTTEEVFGQINDNKFYPIHQRGFCEIIGFKIFDNRLDALRHIENKLILQINRNIKTFGKEHSSVFKKKKILSKIKRLKSSIILERVKNSIEFRFIEE